MSFLNRLTARGGVVVTRLLSLKPDITSRNRAKTLVATALAVLAVLLVTALLTGCGPPWTRSTWIRGVY